jgi:hypothetical protein
MVMFLLPLLLLLGLVHGSLPHGSIVPPFRSLFLHKRITNATFLTGSQFAGTSSSEIEGARAIVEQARKKWSAYKKARFQNPRRNVYTLRPEEPSQAHVRATDNSTASGLLEPEITDEIARAAALLAELSVAEGRYGNTTAAPLQKRANRFWMEKVAHVGTQPYGGDPSYKVYNT